MFVLVVSFLFFACGKQKEKWQGTIEEVNGVTVVKNPIESIYGPESIEIKKELSITDDPEKEEKIFEMLTMLTVDNDGYIYAVDMRACNIKVFDKSGNHRFNIGQEGQGPGEFKRPFRIQYVEPNKILVLDIFNYRLSWLTIKGELLNEISIASLRPSRLESDVLDNLVVRVSSRNEKGHTSEIKKIDSQLNDLFSISSKLHHRTPEGTFPMQTALIQFHISPAGTVIWADEAKYEFNVVDDVGKTIKKIVKEYRPIRITAPEKKRLLEEKFGSQGVFQGREPTFPAFYLPSNDFLINDDGMIIVRTYKRSLEGSKIYDIFDSNGKYIVSIPLPRFPQVWKKDSIYFLERDEEGYQIITRYKVTWNF